MTALRWVAYPKGKTRHAVTGAATVPVCGGRSAPDPTAWYDLDDQAARRMAECYLCSWRVGPPPATTAPPTAPPAPRAPAPTTPKPAAASGCDHAGASPITLGPADRAWTALLCTRCQRVVDDPATTDGQPAGAPA